MGLSLWLEVPDLQPYVDALAAEAGNPTFAAHLTLVGALPCDPADPALDEVVRRLVPPAGVQLTSYGSRGEESRFACLVAERTAELVAVFDRLQAAFPSVRDEHFAAWPHVSLVYGTARARSRWPDPLDAVAALGDAPLGSHRPAAVGVWDTGGDVAGWNRQRSWRIERT